MGMSQRRQWRVDDPPQRLALISGCHALAVQIAPAFAANLRRDFATAPRSVEQCRIQSGGGCRRQRPNYLPPSAWYEYLLAQPEGPELAEAVVTAMEHIEAYNATLAGILPKAYRGFEPRLLMDLLKTFNRDTLNNPSGNVFGKIYEYFLNKFAQTGAQEGGSSSSPA
jgi:type I restriction-modification system DNA methylase subunit